MKSGDIFPCWFFVNYIDERLFLFFNLVVTIPMPSIIFFIHSHTVLMDFVGFLWQDNKKKPFSPQPPKKALGLNDRAPLAISLSQRTVNCSLSPGLVFRHILRLMVLHRHFGLRDLEMSTTKNTINSKISKRVLKYSVMSST